MEDKSDSVKAAELRRRRILGSGDERMEKLTGHKQPPRSAEQNILKKNEVDLDELKKLIPIKKLKQKCLLKLVFLILIFFIGAFSRVFEYKQQDSQFTTFAHKLLTLPLFNNFSKAWNQNQALQLKTVRYLTWGLLVAIILFRTPPEPDKSGSNAKKEKDKKESDEPELPELPKIPPWIKNLLSNIGQWSSAILLMFFLGYDITRAPGLIMEVNSVSFVDGANPSLKPILYAKNHSESHKGSSRDYLKPIIFGGLDGVVTIFAVISGCIGASITPVKIIFIGLGSLFADGLAMGLGEFTSYKAEIDYIESERNREIWEIEYCPEEEKDEMYNIYVSRYGFSSEDAHALVNLIFKNKKFFLNHMMVEELRLMVSDEDNSTPEKRGFIIFLSFFAFGILPLIGFSISLLFPKFFRPKLLQAITTGLSSVTSLGVLGYFKGYFVNHRPWLSSLTMIFTGMMASLVAFGIGNLSPI